MRFNVQCSMFVVAALLFPALAAGESITVIRPQGETSVITLDTPPTITISSTTAQTVTISGGSTSATVVVPGVLTTSGPEGPLGPRGYDGRPGANGYDGFNGKDASTCYISGISSYTYDQAGYNPLPAPGAYSLVMYHEGVQVTPDSVTWGTASGVLSGSATASTFTPAISSAWVAGDNAVTALAVFTEPSVNPYTTLCHAVFPVAVTRIGQTGAQGPPGSNATVTEPNVIGAFNTTTSNSSLVLQATASSATTKLEVRDSGGNTSFFVKSDGQLVAISAVPKLTSSTVSGQYPVNLALSTAYALTIAGGTTINISNARTGIDSFSLALTRGSGTGAISWPASINWGVGITAPALGDVSGNELWVDCRTKNTGVAWRCSYQNY